MKRSIILFITLLIGFTVAKSQNVQNGTYKITTRIETTTSYLTVYKGLGDEGYAYSLSSSDLTTEKNVFQTWTIESVGEGYCSIKVDKDRCLQGSASYVDAAFWYNGEEPTQLWKFIDNGDGYYRLTNKALGEGKCLYYNKESWGFEMSEFT